MNRWLQPVQSLLRATHLLSSAEYFRYLYSRLSYRRRNRAFVAAHPGFTVPPEHLAFDAYSAPHWEFYYRSGIQVADHLVELLVRHGYDLESIRVLEWGCGPGRIVRHLPERLGAHARVWGSDYNPESIAWARQSISGVEFVDNGLHPPLPFDATTFDLVYAFSVFTHLSEESCLRWIDEIERVLKPGGMVYFTAHGDASREFLLPRERAVYDADGFYCRGKVQEGKKMYMALHSPAYVRQTLLRRFQVLEHLPSGTFRYTHQQDAWIARKIA